MNTNNLPVPDFIGFSSGAQGVVSSFGDAVVDGLVPDVFPALVDVFVAMVVIVGLWYGLRAILRAIRVAK